MTVAMQPGLFLPRCQDVPSGGHTYDFTPRSCNARLVGIYSTSPILVQCANGRNVGLASAGRFQPTQEPGSLLFVSTSGIGLPLGLAFLPPGLIHAVHDELRVLDGIADDAGPMARGGHFSNGSPACLFFGNAAEFISFDAGYVLRIMRTLTRSKNLNAM